MPKTPPTIGFLGFCKNNSVLMFRFFGFKSCTIMTFMTLFSRFRVKCKYLKNYCGYKVDFLHAGTYLLKQRSNDVILEGHGKACPGAL